MSSKNDIVCVGDVMVECLLQLPSFPLPDSTVVLDSNPRELGEPAFNICWYLSKLGRQSRLVGPYGQRDADLVAEAFSSIQVDDSGLIPIKGNSDLLISILTDHHHYSIYLRAHLPSDIESTVRRHCTRPKRLILTGSRHAAIRRAFLSLADAFSGHLLAFNPSYAISEYNREELSRLLRKAHVTILNAEEARHACHALNLRNFDQLSKYASGSLIVTLGEKGVTAYQQNDVLEMSSLTSSTRAAVGAGDAFFAGFLFETFRGTCSAEAARFASGLAAYVVETSQVRTQVSEAQIRQRLVRQTG